MGLQDLLNKYDKTNTGGIMITDVGSKEVEINV